MSEPKDPAIKLFGKKIPLLETVSPCCNSTSCGLLPVEGDANLEHQDQDPPRPVNSSPVEDDKSGDDGGGRGEGEGEGEGGVGGEERESEKEAHEENNPEFKQVGTEDSPKPDASTTGITEKAESPKGKSNEAEDYHNNNDTSVSQETKLKKPDRILPCPRCNSMDTKFCYYNNYNVNQPRHFCKKCQRYWTAGGTMRNVPVGAGRRKNKNSGSHYRQITMNAENLQNTRPDLPNGVHHHPSGTSLFKFGSDALLCESMASGLNLVDKAMRKIFQKPEDLKIQIPYDNNPNAIIPPKNPSKDEVRTRGLPDNALGNFQPKVPCFPGAPAWPYPWNSVTWTVLPVYPPPAYWSCPMPTGTWGNFRCTTQPSSHSGSSFNSPTLGKHSRDENIAEQGSSKEDKPVKGKSDSERCLWVPKTLRMDDPGEAAKSSIWETLGIKNERAGMFRGFQSNDKEKHCVEENPRQALQANPAALSISVKFHESS